MLPIVNLSFFTMIMIPYKDSAVGWVVPSQPLHQDRVTNLVDIRLYGLGKSYPRIACRRALKSLQGH